MKKRRPDCLFDGAGRASFVSWRKRFKRHYLDCLGPFPVRVPLKVQRLERKREKGYVREKLLFSSSPGVNVPAYLLIPDNLGPKERRPALLAAHGHGGGKTDVCGLPHPEWGAQHSRWTKAMHYDYARQAVLRGYVVLAPDFAPFGERALPKAWLRPDRDACDIAHLALQYFGYNLLTMNLWDAMRGLDLLAKHPAVDAKRIGVIGLSYGGTIASHLLALDPRVKAGVVSGYLSTLGDALGHSNGNTCGAQALPGLAEHGDIPEILGLAAPKPILFEMGSHEDCFYYPDMLKAFSRVKKIYAAAGAAASVRKDVFDGPHRFNGERAWDWLSAVL
jgi:dienelactone hydrolase